MPTDTLPAVPETAGDPVVPLLISAAALARMLSVSVATVWRMNSAGRIPAGIRIGGSRRWRLRDIETWVARGCPDEAFDACLMRGESR
jgi:predicted DNA-binding transcriptional regulator AlpA